MALIRVVFGSIILLFSVVAPGFAALPNAVDGKPLPSLAPMLDKTALAVVNISAETVEQGQTSPLFQDPFFRRFFDVPTEQYARKSQSLGSGVIVDAKQGYIVTNQHVIANATRITVTLKDGRELKARQVGSDEKADVAVIQVAPERLTAVRWSDSDKLRVGDFVVAIGNPFGLGQTVTSGIVSALGRSGLGIEDFEDFIQTDASINPGNSGGALVNLRGELVGINTAILGGGGGSVGIGFAIPANMAKQIMQQLVTHGRVQRGRLGLSPQDLTPELVKAFRLKQQSGAVVTYVEPGSAAAKAGVKRGDVITHVGKRKIRRADDMRNVVGLMLVGQSVEMRLIRNGRERKVRATISAVDRQTLKGRGISIHLDGAVFTNRRESGQYYVEVTQVERRSTAWAAGLRKRDIILSANREALDNVDDLARSIDGKNDPLLLNIQRGNRAQFILLR